MDMEHWTWMGQETAGNWNGVGLPASPNNTWAAGDVELINDLDRSSDGAATGASLSKATGNLNNVGCCCE